MRRSFQYRQLQLLAALGRIEQLRDEALANAKTQHETLRIRRAYTLARERLKVPEEPPRELL